MNKILSLSAQHPLSGEVTLPGDKSLSHRAALFASLAEGVSVIDRFLDSGVTRAMLEALTELGIEWNLEGDRLTVTGKGLHGYRKPLKRLYCGGSATTIRMLAGALAASGTPAVLDGSPGLRKRPMNRITEPLAKMGLRIASENGCAPMIIPGRDPSLSLHAITYSLSIASAQVKSCLILAALAGDAVSVITEPAHSRDHTERMLTAMGAKITPIESTTIRVEPLTAPLKPLQIKLSGDISSASFLIVAALIVPGSSIVIKDINLNRTRTGLLDALRHMGAKIRIESQHRLCSEQVGDIHVDASDLHGVTIQGDDIVRMIDEIPALAVAASFAKGCTTIRDAQELRYKETDRIDTLCKGLSKLGVEVEERPDGMTIRGGTLQGGECESYGDHRLAMALSLAGLVSPKPVRVHHAEAVSQSFPDFVKVLTTLGVVPKLENQ